MLQSHDEKTPLAPSPLQNEGAPSQQAPCAVDTKLLAEKVYRLMLADARLARARGGRMAGMERVTRQ